MGPYLCSPTHICIHRCIHQCTGNIFIKISIDVHYSNDFICQLAVFSIKVYYFLKLLWDLCLKLHVSERLFNQSIILCPYNCFVLGLFFLVFLRKISACYWKERIRKHRTVYWTDMCKSCQKHRCRACWFYLLWLARGNKKETWWKRGIITWATFIW